MTAGRFAEGGVVASAVAAATLRLPRLAKAVAAVVVTAVAVAVRTRGAVGAHGAPAGEPGARSRAGAPPR